MYIFIHDEQRTKLEQRGPNSSMAHLLIKKVKTKLNNNSLTDLVLDVFRPHASAKTT